ncbi:hypothetical protein MANES_06G034275v8 [Manihot esculenta]|uniref:Uncharacterized protein n=1 Tax=Manihot esculenta TaxID=3983 RepID=A0ACB7HI76_MANES|nr:hypothetical protein MANES_06G034275v8 [Manihot esculenta]
MNYLCEIKTHKTNFGRLACDLPVGIWPIANLHHHLDLAVCISCLQVDLQASQKWVSPFHYQHHRKCPLNKAMGVAKIVTLPK